MTPQLHVASEPYQKPVVEHERVDGFLERLHNEQVVERIWQHDPTLWTSSTTQPTLSLGWLDVIDEVLVQRERIEQLVADLCEENYTHAILIGTGGAILTSKVLCSVFGVKQGYLNLTALESIAPLAISRCTETLDPTRTLFVICSKTGQTVETAALLRYFYQWIAAHIGDQATAGSHFIAITDPGSELEKVAVTLRFRALFLDNPQVCGHCSALSYFGMVPAALTGIDIRKLLLQGREATAECKKMGADSPSAWLAAQIASYASTGQDKVTFITSTALSHLGLWLEQLIAVSLGKPGTTLFPVEGEALLKPKYYQHDRLFFYLRMLGDSALDAAVEQLQNAGQPVIQIDITHLTDLGAEFFRWQMGCALASFLMGNNPFHQPNIDRYKASISHALADSSWKAQPSESIIDVASQSDDELDATLRTFLQQESKADEHDMSLPYIALLAFLPSTEEISETLIELRTQIQRRLRLATSIGYSPQFLHSTTEMHLGSSGTGLFIQFTAVNDEIELFIPRAPGVPLAHHTFGQLLNLQADLNLQMLRQAQKQVIRFHLGNNIVVALHRLIAQLREWDGS